MFGRSFVAGVGATDAAASGCARRGASKRPLVLRSSSDQRVGTGMVAIDKEVIGRVGVAPHTALVRRSMGILPMGSRT